MQQQQCGFSWANTKAVYLGMISSKAELNQELDLESAKKMGLITKTHE